MGGHGGAARPDKGLTLPQGGVGDEGRGVCAKLAKLRDHKSLEPTTTKVKSLSLSLWRERESCSRKAESWNKKSLQRQIGDSFFLLSYLLYVAK